MSEPDLSRDAFRLPNPFGDPVRKKVFGVVTSACERLLVLDRCADVYAKLPVEAPCEELPSLILRDLGVTWSLDGRQPPTLRAGQPLIVVANHPFGAVEGLVLAEVLRSVRPDIRILANVFLERIPRLGGLFIGVDPFGGAGAAKSNARSVREAIRWVRGGGVLVVFPAGEVSSLRLRTMDVADPDWSPSLARLVRATRASVLPVFVEGRNSAVFQLLGLLHPRLRTALLPREFLRSAGKTIRLRFGSVVPVRRLEEFPSDKEVVEHLRLRTYLLAGRRADEPERAEALGRGPAKTQEPVAAAADSERLAAEVESLPGEQTLAESGPYVVLHAEARQIPALLREIGRLRELAFRGAGEGTGKAVDLDCFDEYYRHLFIWDRDRREIVGGYRLGETDTILGRFGPDGLYSRTLFTYGPEFLERIGPALELGRSFVREEHQKTYAPLLLLWKGIAQFVVRNPRYRVLFGAVSVSREYSALSRHLIAASLRGSRFVSDLARMVDAKVPVGLTPPKVKGSGAPREWPSALEVDDLASMVKDLEVDSKGLPVLLRQYLNLGGKLLSFSVDRDFADVVDGLILVDLLKTPGAVIEKFMGIEGAAAFRSFHR
ncbi:MAG: lysophospholipid acyltransferase family protein [Deltaproteobacteria bacterium]|nr:lysophospholipid acyltransferase family protein [Deltaproteobacteria bacterium]